MGTTSIPDYERGLTFEQVWVSIKELREAQKMTDQQMKESFQQIKESNRQIKESNQQMRESNQQMKESNQQMRESNQQMREDFLHLANGAEYFRQKMEASSSRLDKQLGELGNRFGEMIEYLASPGLKAKFRAYGFAFTELSHDKEFATEDRIIAEADVFLENTEKAMVVEMKSKPTIDDINDHVGRLVKLRKYADAKGDMRKYMGAIGGMIFRDRERDHALKCGLYVIEPSGDTFDVIAPTGKYHPGEW